MKIMYTIMFNLYMYKITIHYIVSRLRFTLVRSECITLRSSTIIHIFEYYNKRCNKVGTRKEPQDFCKFVSIIIYNLNCLLLSKYLQLQCRLFS